MKKVKKSKDITLNTLLTARTAVFGIAAIWILLFHLQPYLGTIPIPRVPSVIGMGNIGVDIFLFLSAIGLCNSYKKNTIKISMLLLFITQR